MDTLITVAVLTLLISGICSLFEATLYSIPIPTIEAALANRKRRQIAQRLLAMKKSITRPTSAILILNTLANTGGATIVGVYAVQIFGVSWMPLFSGLFTLSILLLSEILPKTYGAVQWRHLWPLIVWPLAFLEKLFHPLIRIIELVTRFLSREHPTSKDTQGEIISMIRLGASSGELSKIEQQLLNSVFHFDELVCRQVMVPRREVIFLEATYSLTEALDMSRRTKHSRYPLCHGSLDDAIGLIHIKDLVHIHPDPKPELLNLIRPFPAVPETLPLSELLRRMQEEHLHMSLVVDEHGTAVGIITLENILEELVGAVQDEFDREVPEIVAEGDRCYRVKGQISLSRLNRELGLDLNTRHADTLSGLLVNNLGRLPRGGEFVKLKKTTAKVLEVKQGLAYQVLLQLEPTSESCE